MILRDGKGKVKKMWGGYSPKVYDGHFLELYRNWMEKRLKGAGVIADQHFEWGAKNLKEVKFFTAYHEPRFSRKKPLPANDDDDGVGLTVLTKKQESFNSTLYKLRARVELPFGEAKSIFGVLKRHWWESDNQLDHMVWIAAGLSNSRR